MTNYILLLKNIDENKTNIKVVVTTAFDSPASREKCLKLGVKAYLRKPVDGEALIDIITYNTEIYNSELNFK